MNTPKSDKQLPNARAQTVDVTLNLLVVSRYFSYFSKVWKTAQTYSMFSRILTAVLTDHIKAYTVYSKIKLRNGMKWTASLRRHTQIMSRRIQCLIHFSRTWVRPHNNKEHTPESPCPGSVFPGLVRKNHWAERGSVWGELRSANGKRIVMTEVEIWERTKLNKERRNWWSTPNTANRTNNGPKTMPWDKTQTELNPNQ